MGTKYFQKLEDKKYLKDEKNYDGNINYKKKYYALIRSLSQMHTTMQERCPIVRSCCGGCNLLKRKINQIKREDKYEN